MGGRAGRAGQQQAGWPAGMQAYRCTGRWAGGLATVAGWRAGRWAGGRVADVRAGVRAGGCVLTEGGRRRVGATTRTTASRGKQIAAGPLEVQIQASRTVCVSLRGCKGVQSTRSVRACWLAAAPAPTQTAVAAGACSGVSPISAENISQQLTGAPYGLHTTAAVLANSWGQPQGPVGAGVFCHNRPLLHQL